MKLIQLNKKDLISKFLMLMLGSALLFTLSCKETEGFNSSVSKDQTKPAQVTAVKVENYSGGAIITYSLPTTENLLYIMAEYRINDRVVRQSKSSYYTDTIRVDGFSKSADYDVSLYAVSRAEVKSDPFVVKVHPATPTYLGVRPTVVMQPDFGGVQVTASNPDKRPIGVIIITTDKTTGKLLPVEQYYTDLSNVVVKVRGYDPIERDFGVYITDRWGNISDTLMAKITPIFEELVPKSGYFVYDLPSDSKLGATGLGFTTSRMWDDNNMDPGWHTEAGSGKPLQVCTFGIGKLTKLSRYKLWERGVGYGTDYSYKHANPRTWTLWGSASNAPQDVDLPVTSAYGTIVGDWVNLGNFTCPPPPSGKPPGQTTPADLAAVYAGFEFDIPLSAPKVKFFRLAVSSTWGNTDFAHVMELSFYGDTK